MSIFHYFAYGSNLLSARLRERTPSAKVIGIAELPGHELRWHKSGRDNSGKCDLIVSAGCLYPVQGVVYEIARIEKPALDAAEDLGVGYAEKTIDVQINGCVLSASAYFALQVDPSAVPYDWYKALVISGAREHGLAASYLKHLQSVAAKLDSDALRSERHWRLLRS